MYKSTSKLRPTKGRVIIKVITLEFNSKDLVQGVYNDETKRCYIDAIYNHASDFKVGDRISIEHHTFSRGFIEEANNIASLKVISDDYKALTEVEQEEFVEERPTVQLTEYMSVYENERVAIVK